MEDFKLHPKGEDDGHWKSQYWGPHGVIRRDRELFRAAAAVLEAFNRSHFGQELDESGDVARLELVKAYRFSLLAYLSTLYSARLYWPPTIKTLSDTLKGYYALTAHGVDGDGITVDTPEQLEALMAFHQFLGGLPFWQKDNEHLQQAKFYGLKVLNSFSAPLATELLVMARLSRLKVLSRKVRTDFRQWVIEGVAEVVTGEGSLSEKISQGWKTVNRLSRLIGLWEFVELSLSKDRSRDLWIKSWMCPGYIFYKMRTFFVR
jgi:hypothetical protein